MASEPAFADTSFFFALAAKRDLSHSAAASAFAKLLRLARPVVTSDYVLDEALALTKSRTNSAVALALLERIEQSETIAMEQVTGERFGRAKAFFRKHADHGYSFTDCTSFIIMRDLRITDALTADRHFEEAGFRLLLPAR